MTLKILFICFNMFFINDEKLCCGDILKKISSSLSEKLMSEPPSPLTMAEAPPGQGWRLLRLGPTAAAQALGRWDWHCASAHHCPEQLPAAPVGLLQILGGAASKRPLHQPPLPGPGGGREA